nr:MAG TPA: hypothetical protein [Caudoviricetes sp.]
MTSFCSHFDMYKCCIAVLRELIARQKQLTRLTTLLHS